MCKAHWFGLSLQMQEIKLLSIIPFHHSIGLGGLVVLNFKHESNIFPKKIKS